MGILRKNKPIDKRDGCKHDFYILREVSQNKNDGGKIDPSVSVCKKCDVKLETSDAIIYQGYRDQARATSALIITTIIAFITLILVAISFYLDYIK